MKPRTVDLLQAAEVIGMGQRLAYTNAQTHDYLVPGVPVIRIGRKVRVSVHHLEELVGQLDGYFDDDGEGDKR